jgi:hypothetical protein
MVVHFETRCTSRVVEARLRTTVLCAGGSSYTLKGGCSLAGRLLRASEALRLFFQNLATSYSSNLWLLESTACLLEWWPRGNGKDLDCYIERSL